MEMPGDENHADCGFLCHRGADNDLTASALELDRVAVSDTVDVGVGGVNLKAGFGVDFVQDRVTSHRAAVPMLEQTACGKDEGIFIVHLFAHGNVIQRVKFSLAAREGLFE